MAYSAPIFQGGDHSDAVAQYTAQGLSSMGQGLADGLAGLFGNIEKSKQARLEDKTAGKLWDAFAKINPEVEQFSAMFYGADKGTKKSILGGLMEMFQGRDQAAAAADQRGLAREKFEWEKKPPLPPTTVKVGEREMGFDPNTGRPFELPPLPDTSGAEVVPLPGTNYGQAVFNGRPQGVIPLKQKDAQGLTLLPVEGTDRAYLYGPDGQRVPGSPEFQRQKATTMGGVWDVLRGKGGYAPVPDGKTAAPGKEKWDQIGEDLFYTAPDGRRFKAVSGMPTPANQKAGQRIEWQEVTKPDALASPLFPDGMLPPGGYADPAVPPPAALQQPVRKLW